MVVATTRWQGRRLEREGIKGGGERERKKRNAREEKEEEASSPIYIYIYIYAPRALAVYKGPPYCGYVLSC